MDVYSTAIGAGETLTLDGGAWEFQPIVRGLRQRGHEAHAIDLPGHRDNPAPLSEVTMDAYVQRVVEAVEDLEGPLVLVGHSLGGAIISQVAERRMQSAAVDKVTPAGDV